jgi:hypothetical protein
MNPAPVPSIGVPTRSAGQPRVLPCECGGYELVFSRAFSDIELDADAGCYTVGILAHYRLIAEAA